MTTHRRHDDNTIHIIWLFVLAIAMVCLVCSIPTLYEWTIAIGYKLWAWMDWVMTTTENFHAR